MSIATEITRLSDAKAALKTSIESKGVTVPVADKLDLYPAHVDAITQGGGADITYPTHAAMLADTTQDVGTHAQIIKYFGMPVFFEDEEFDTLFAPPTLISTITITSGNAGSWHIATVADTDNEYSLVIGETAASITGAQGKAEYTSSDGITYTRTGSVTDTLPIFVDLGEDYVFTDTLGGMDWERETREILRRATYTSSLICGEYIWDGTSWNIKPGTFINPIELYQTTGAAVCINFRATTIVEMPMLDSSTMITISRIFQTCASLKVVPELPLDVANLAHSAFKGCAALETFPKILYLPQCINTTELFEDAFTTNGRENQIVVMGIENTTTSVRTLVSMFETCGIKNIQVYAGHPTSGTLPLLSLEKICLNNTIVESFVISDTLSEGSFLAWSAGDAFSGCTNLTHLAGVNSPGGSASRLRTLKNCSKLTTLADCPDMFSGTHTSSSMGEAFNGCTLLEYIPNIASPTASDTLFANTFSGCAALTTVSFTSLRASINLSDSPLLTYDTLIGIIDSLHTTSKTLTLGATNLAKLTAAEIQVGTDKGWTIN